MDYKTQTDPPIELTCLVCGGKHFEVTNKYQIENPAFPYIPGSPRWLTMRHGFNIYSCNSCGFLMNFKSNKSPRHTP